MPYWADSLDKIKVIGAHIFYVWRGSAGSRTAFNGLYAGEHSALADGWLPADQRGDAAAAPALAAQDFQQSARQLDPNAAGGSRARRAFLVADEGAEPLLADQGPGSGPQGLPRVHLSSQKNLPDLRPDDY